MSFIAGYLLGLSEGGTIIEKSITANGTYYAKDDNADGFDPINVKVSSKYGDGFSDGIKYANGDIDTIPDVDIDDAPDIFNSISGDDGFNTEVGISDPESGWTLVQSVEYRANGTGVAYLKLINTAAGKETQLYSMGRLDVVNMKGSILAITSEGVQWQVVVTYEDGTSRTLNSFVTGKGKSGWAEFYGSSYSVGKY